MASTDEQPRPDLDAAIDAVLPSLTAVSDDAAATSLRRTRIALAEAAPEPTGVGAWRWAAVATAMTVALLFVAVWRPWSPIEAPRVAIDQAPPLPAKPLPTPPQSIARTPLPSRTIAQTAPGWPLVPPVRRARDLHVRATAIASPSAAPRPDPLIALTHAVQAIPEDAWNAMTRAQDPLTTPALAIDPIAVPPLVTPPIADATAGPLAEGDR